MRNLLFVFLSIFTIPLVSFAQDSIVGYEYFFDADPGLGNGNFFALTGTLDTQFVLNINVSALGSGNHTLFLRSKTAGGVWSLTQEQGIINFQAPASNDLIGFEYFYDSDPGDGNGTFVSHANTQDFEVVQNISPPPTNGNHILSFRSLDENGIWSQTTSQTLLKNTANSPLNLKGLEYYFDTDPGIGNGSIITLANSQDINNQNFLASVGSLPIGMHKLGIRTYDENVNYSHTNHFILYKDDNSNFEITSLEYFVGDDPGLGNGTPVSISSGFDIQDIFRTFSPGSWTNLANHLSIRSKDQNGTWSLTNNVDLAQFGLDTSKIILYEYFVNNDPGLGNGTSIPVIKDFDIEDLQLNVTILGNGFHSFGIRSLDSLGKWSLTNHNQIAQFGLDTSKIVYSEYYINNDPGLGNGTSIPLTKDFNIEELLSNVSITGEGIKNLGIRSLDSLGKWSLTNQSQLFNESSPNLKIDSVEYFIDSDPGYGNGTPIPITKSGNIIDINQSINAGGLDQGMHALHIRTRDSLLTWAHDNVSNFYLDLSPKNVPLRSGEYFFDADPGHGLASPFTFPETVDYNNLTVLIMGTSLPIGVHDLYIRTMDTLGVWSHTNIKDSVEVSMPLPVSWLSFNAEKSGQDVSLTWEISDKINVSHYNVQKYEHGAYINIGKVIDKLESYKYEFLDHYPTIGINTYRIQQVDYDGRSTLSPERVIFFDKEIGITVGPNPTQSVINLMGITTPFNFSVYNQNGQLIINEQNSSKKQINLDNHPDGSYYLVLNVHNVEYKFFIIKI